VGFCEQPRASVSASETTEAMAPATSELSLAAERLLGSAVLPISLLIVASGLIVFQFMSQETVAERIMNFLIQIVVQMVPLCALQMRVGKCSDPMGLLTRFAPKVIIMHIIFLAPRFIFNVFYKQAAQPIIVVAVALIAAFTALVRGFDFRLSSFSVARINEHRDVMFITGLTIPAALCTTALEAFVRPNLYFRNGGYSFFFWDLLFTVSNYIEIVSLVPAVVTVYTMDVSKPSMHEGFNAKETTQAAVFFSFMSAFYIHEDLVQAIQTPPDLMIAAIAYFVHFVLLLDFVGYFLVHVYNLGATKSQLLMAAIGMV